MIDRSTNIRAALRQRQRGFIINPFRFGGGGGGSDPYFSSVSSLLHLDGTNGSTSFPDEKGIVWTPSGNAQVSTSSPKFGSGSLLLDGSGDFLLSEINSSLGFATGDFTIEGWLKRGAIGSDQGVYVRGLLSGGFNQESLAHAVFFGADNLLNFRIYNGSSGLVNIASLASLTDTANWHHFAVVASGSTLYAFLDGVLQGTAAYVQQNDGATWRSVIGSFGAAWGVHYNGRLDDLRITKGVARYTSSFTPPSAAFPNS